MKEDQGKSTREEEEQGEEPEKASASGLHVTNLRRPYTLMQLQELLGETVAFMAGTFATDRIRSQCYVEVGGGCPPSSLAAHPLPVPA